MKKSVKKGLLIAATVTLALVIALSIYLTYVGVLQTFTMIDAMPNIHESFWTFRIAIELTVISSIILGAASVGFVLCIIKLIYLLKSEKTNP